MNVSLEKINEQYFANANVYPQIPLKSSKRKRLTMQTKPDIRYPEEVRHSCTFRVIKIVVNVQIYMGAWAWNVKTMT